MRVVRGAVEVLGRAPLAGDPAAAEHGVSEQDALQKGMEQKASEFKESGAEVYAKT